MDPASGVRAAVPRDDAAEHEGVVDLANVDVTLQFLHCQHETTVHS